MKYAKLTMAPILAVLISASAQANTACSQLGNAIGLVGLDSGNGVVFASVSTASSRTCNCNSVRFNPERTDTDKALSILLTAKMANKKVRIDLLDVDNCNSAYRVYIH